MIKVNYDEKTGKVIAFNKNSAPYIEITEEERKQPLPDKYSYYAVVDGKFTIQRRELSIDEILRDSRQTKTKRIKEIEAWLKANDWKFNKVFLGEWEQTDPRWLSYLEERAKLRTERDELEKEVSEWTS
jgi:hypothetical protein